MWDLVPREGDQEDLPRKLTEANRLHCLSQSLVLTWAYFLTSVPSLDISSCTLSASDLGLSSKSTRAILLPVHYSHGMYPILIRFEDYVFNLLWFEFLPVPGYQWTGPKLDQFCWSRWISTSLKAPQPLAVPPLLTLQSILTSVLIAVANMKNLWIRVRGIEGPYLPWCNIPEYNFVIDPFYF